MPAAMKSFASTTAVALQIAGSASGVPYLGAAGEILGHIIVACDSVTVNKKKAKAIKDKCTQLQGLLAEEQSKVDGTESSEHVSEAIVALDGIRSRMSRVARAKSWELWKSGSLDATLERCKQDLDLTQEKLNLKTQLTLVAGQQHLRNKTDSIEDAILDLRDHLRTIVNSGRLPREVETSLRNVESDTNTGYVQLMEAGQRGVRGLKLSTSTPSSLIIASEETASPTSSPGPSRGGSKDTHDLERLEDTLYKFHVKTGTLPANKVLNEEIVKVGELPIAGGVYSDIWPGMWLGHKKVALKALRNTKADDPRAQARFVREVTMWAELSHEHILPFFGIVTGIGKHIHMVSPWQENGNILVYVESHKHTNRLGLIKGAAAGLQYLHEKKIVHGNVKCTNILVTDKGEACISDFGMSKLVEEVTATSASATLTQQDGSTRWLAPELIMGEISSPTLRTDTYSFGMTVLELVTGKHPYAEKRNYLQVIQLIGKGQVPQRPEEIRDDKVWQFLLKCWQHEAKRPSMAEVNAELEILL
ncbi:kinase-like protein [Coprinellus micaceus]|uniref:Kinase-like protein n=1 Tax=Coprinellus micaceus TaxID=71717 RepID=A0A4Y7TQ24_COPMI|nr:kinase-like protein [Coprinellus micaceus]